MKDQNLPDAKLLICEVLDGDALRGVAKGDVRKIPMSESLIVYDEMGAGEGSLIAVTESAEAAAPFRPRKVPLDAYCSEILDHIELFSKVTASKN